MKTCNQDTFCIDFPPLLARVGYRARFTLRCAAVGCVFQDAKDYLGGNGTKFTGSWPYANLADVLADPEFTYIRSVCNDVHICNDM